MTGHLTKLKQTRKQSNNGTFSIGKGKKCDKLSEKQSFNTQNVKGHSTRTQHSPTHIPYGNPTRAKAWLVLKIKLDW